MNRNPRVNSVFRHITVEPASFFYFLAYIIVDGINTNLFLQKGCRPNATTEPNLDTPCDDEKPGLISASKMNSHYRSVMFVFCMIYTILATCWSDEAGKRRRPLVFLPILGIIFQSLSGCLHSHFWHWTPDSAALSGVLCEAISGGVVLMGIATQMYVCDVSDTDDRTMRLGLLFTVKIICLPIGGGCVGFLVRGVGFFYSYLLCFVLSIISLALALGFVKDVSVPVEKKRHFLQLFNLMRVVDSFEVVFRKSLGRKRIVVFILLVVYVSTYFTTQGEKTVLYLFLRHKFRWNEKDYSVYQIYKHVGVILGSIFCSVVLSKRLKIHDGLIGAFAGFCDTVTVFGFLLASQNWHLYVVPLFDVFHGTAISVSVSYLSKFYDSNELGRLNAVINVFSLIIPTCHLAYQVVFRLTMNYFPSAFFLISAVMDTGISLLYYASYVIGQQMGV